MACDLRTAAVRLLVIDESAERRELLRAGLCRAGYEVAAMLGSPAALLETIVLGDGVAKCRQIFVKAYYSPHARSY